MLGSVSPESLNPKSYFEDVLLKGGGGFANNYLFKRQRLGFRVQGVAYVGPKLRP